MLTSWQIERAAQVKQELPSNRELVLSLGFCRASPTAPVITGDTLLLACSTMPSYSLEKTALKLYICMQTSWHSRGRGILATGPNPSLSTRDSGFNIGLAPGRFESQPEQGPGEPQVQTQMESLNLHQPCKAHFGKRFLRLLDVIYCWQEAFKRSKMRKLTHTPTDKWREEGRQILWLNLQRAEAK